MFFLCPILLSREQSGRYNTILYNLIITNKNFRENVQCHFAIQLVDFATAHFCLSANWAQILDNNLKRAKYSWINLTGLHCPKIL